MSGRETKDVSVQRETRHTRERRGREHTQSESTDTVDVSREMPIKKKRKPPPLNPITSTPVGSYRHRHTRFMSVFSEKATTCLGVGTATSTHDA